MSVSLQQQILSTSADVAAMSQLECVVMSPNISYVTYGIWGHVQISKINARVSTQTIFALHLANVGTTCRNNVTSSECRAMCVVLGGWEGGRVDDKEMPKYPTRILRP